MKLGEIERGDLVALFIPNVKRPSPFGLGLVVAIGDDCNERTPGLTSLQAKDEEIIEVMWSTGAVWKHSSKNLKHILKSS